MSKNRILIVEDEEAIAKMIVMNLKVANYDTAMYLDGREAADALDSDHNYYNGPHVKTNPEKIIVNQIIPY